MLCIPLYFQMTAQTILVHTKIFLRRKLNFPILLFLIPSENQDAAELIQCHELLALSSHNVWHFNLKTPASRAMKTQLT